MDCWSTSPGTLLEKQRSGPTTDLFNQNLWEQGSGICSLTCTPGDSHTHDKMWEALLHMMCTHRLLQPSLVPLILACDAPATLAIFHFLNMSCFLPFGALYILSSFWLVGSSFRNLPVALCLSCFEVSLIVSTWESKEGVLMGLVPHYFIITCVYDLRKSLIRQSWIESYGW